MEKLPEPILKEEEKLSKIIERPKLTPEEFKEAKKLNPLSRAITKVLRHTAAKLKLKISADGYVEISDLFKVPPIAKFKPNMEILEKVVKYDNKGRMQISEDKKFIRAVQGHTIKVNFCN